MPDRDALYDEYLDALLGGLVAAPEVFLRERGVSDDSELLAALKTLYQHRGATPDGGTRLGAAPAATGVNGASGAPAARRVGEFTILRRIGRGGMGEVHLARQESLGREVALKLIRPDAAHSANAAARFDREARAAARLRHPGIVQVHAVGEDRGTRYIAMELVDGRPLDEILEENKQAGRTAPTERAVRWVIAVARALDYAHAHGVIHRDVKPSNILISPDDRPLLVDFGLARELDGPSVTISEGFAGSPFYAAPEQIGRAGGLTDGRTDIYSLGVVLYQCLTGALAVAPGTIEQVFQSILVEEPRKPRSLNGAIPRDLELVTLKAIEKDPARRYATAGAFGDDLQAILDHRPVSVRPAGRIERLAKWSRRNPAAAAVTWTGLSAALLLGLILGGQRVAQAQARRAQATAALQEARRLVGEFRTQFERTRALEEEYAQQGINRNAGYFTRVQDRAVDQTEDQVMAARKEREHAQLRVLELSDRAERLGADSAEVAQVRGELYFERFLQARVGGDAAGKTLYRTLTLANDRDGVLAARLRGDTRVSIESDAPGTTLHLFRRVLESELRDGGEGRLVNVPWRGASDPKRPGTWALRAVRGAGELREGDYVLELAGRPIRETVLVVDLDERGEAARAGVSRWARAVRADATEIIDEWFVDALGEDPAPRTFVFEAEGREITLGPVPYGRLGVVLAGPARAAGVGGARARVWSEGRERAAEMSPGGEYRVTAAPALTGPESVLGECPLREAALEAGDYLLIAQAPGRGLVRKPFRVDRDHAPVLKLTLPRVGEGPEGFVYCGGNTQLAPFWIMEHEVTVREYFEFLNDPMTQAEIGAAGAPIRYPRDGETANGQRGPDGRFLLPAGWRWEWPIVFVSWEDAKAYAAWRTRRAGSAARVGGGGGGGGRELYDLPGNNEWIAACGMAEGCFYVFGDRFRPKWVSSCFARPRPDPEPVMRFPIDESALGVFDMAGSASEWTTTRWRPDQPHMYFAGGNWGTGEPRDFTAYGGNGSLPDRVSGSIGFRLIMRKEPAPAAGGAAEGGAP